jgi:hypothetical protein
MAMTSAPASSGCSVTGTAEIVAQISVTTAGSRLPATTALSRGVGGLIGKQCGCVHRLAGGRPLAHLRLDYWRALVVECEDNEEVRVQDDAQAPRA